MHPSKDRTYYLLKSYTDGTASEEEKKELYDWTAQTTDDSEIKNYVKHLIEKHKADQYPEVDWKNMYRQILEKAQPAKKTYLVRRRKWLRTAAAILIFTLGGGTIYKLTSNSQLKNSVPAIAKNLPSTYKNDIMPGKTKAILRSGSSSVVLSSTDTSFTLAGNKVKISNGDVKIAGAKPVEYTLIVPRGGTYSLFLADGTKVWMNAESRLVYPSVFNGDTREVKLTGEAYFEVATDARHPFIVHTEHQEVTVLGTAFNLRAYKDEPYAATLVKGKVVVKDHDEQLVLRPGQQARINENGYLRLNEHPNMEQVIAWKNGYFRFNKADIQTIMNSLSRWYDIEVEYRTNLPRHYFGAIMNRDNNISKILKMLEATDEVHFEIDGKLVTVSE